MFETNMEFSYWIEADMTLPDPGFQYMALVVAGAVVGLALVGYACYRVYASLRALSQEYEEMKRRQKIEAEPSVNAI